MDLTEIMKSPHNALLEEITQILMDKTQNSFPHFFRVMTVYEFCKVASNMRAEILAQDLGSVPINLYALALMPSGAGKGYSKTILEDQIMSGFKERFLNDAMPAKAEVELAKIAAKRASSHTDATEEEEFERCKKEYDSTGQSIYSFDSATVPAVKQYRHRLLLAKAGALSFEMDEVGSNLSNNAELFSTFLELYDLGKTKNKLVKNTAENKRLSEIKGTTPTNMLLFGEPIKTLDGASTEELLRTLLETGYARRCVFSYSDRIVKPKVISAEDLFNQFIQHNTHQSVEDLKDRFEALADVNNFHRKIAVSKDISVELIDYKLLCEKRAEEMAVHETMLKAEMAHRHWKVIKIAGAFAFMEDSPSVKQEHLHAAIKFVEESGQDFYRILNQERNFQKFAKFVSSQPEKEFTHADLLADLPYYPNSEVKRRELLTLATSWGYKNNAIIKRRYEDGIELISGDSLKETSLDQLIVSASSQITENYQPKITTFEKIAKFTQNIGKNMCSHHFVDNYRLEANALPDFNTIYIDVDGTETIERFEKLFSDYQYILYTTKSHTDKSNRFRVIFPTSHVLRLSSEEFVEFMSAIYDWLPFDVDDQTSQRNRKWACHSMELRTNEGKLLDVLPFIPRTSKNDQRIQKNKELKNLNSLERWFIENTASGNRSNNLIRYALLLVDSGYSSDAIESSIKELNDKLPDKLTDAEISKTIMRTVYKRIGVRDATS